MEEAEAEALKRFLEGGGGDADAGRGALTGGLPNEFFEAYVMQGLRLRHVEPGRLICSLKVPPRLLVSSRASQSHQSIVSLHGGATATLVDVVGSGVIVSHGLASTGVSVEINVSYFDSPSLDEEIEIEARALHIGKNIGVVSVEFRKKNGKIIAQGRHTKYLAVTIPSKI